jgi:hypothetical protein
MWQGLNIHPLSLTLSSEGASSPVRRVCSFQIFPGLIVQRTNLLCPLQLGKDTLGPNCSLWTFTWSHLFSWFQAFPGLCGWVAGEGCLASWLTSHFALLWSPCDFFSLICQVDFHFYFVIFLLNLKKNCFFSFFPI